jgi:feruloyl-CoA synthase
MLQTFPFMREEPPVIVDWLPWNHIFGGNHNVGIVLYNGGSLYIDDGKPIPAAIKKTVESLGEIAPTMYFNVPKGLEELIPYLRREPALRERFFSRLKMMFYAGAGMPQPVWDALDELAVETIGERIVITTGLGCTESSPSALFANWPGGFSGLLGTPMPGLELRLVPNEDKLEARYRGPNLMRAYWRQPELSAAAFDEEGFYHTGDALRFVDPRRPDLGLIFDGRIAKDFKLATGTWVSVGMLRATLIATGSPLLQDVAIAGHDREYLSAILFPNLDVCREVAGELAANVHAGLVVMHPRVRATVQSVLDRLGAQSTGSATRIARAILAEVPPSVDAGEITDKGSINQRAVLRARPSLVTELYEEPPSPRVFIADAKP